MPHNKMSIETRASLTLLIAEIQRCKNLKSLNALLDCWEKFGRLEIVVHSEETPTEWIPIEEVKE